MWPTDGWAAKSEVNQGERGRQRRELFQVDPSPIARRPYFTASSRSRNAWLASLSFAASTSRADSAELRPAGRPRRAALNRVQHAVTCNRCSPSTPSAATASRAYSAMWHCHVGPTLVQELTLGSRHAKSEARKARGRRSVLPDGRALASRARQSGTRPGQVAVLACAR